jgi:segregation and condensation protein A
MEPEGYRIATDFFEGPLDLLLHLIRKNRFNILDVRLADITHEYLAHLERMTGINPSRESDFLVTAATLIAIKARTLLPRTDLPGEESPEKALLHSLIERDQLLKISRLLQEMEEVEVTLWRREVIEENFASREFAIAEVSAFQLSELFFSLVRRKEKEEFLTVAAKSYSIDEKKREIMAMLEKEGFVDFSAWIWTLGTLEEIVVSFFTLLELVKRHLVVAVQKELFGRISLWRSATGS